jgi:hypothetical protein
LPEEGKKKAPDGLILLFFLLLRVVKEKDLKISYIRKDQRVFQNSALSSQEKQAAHLLTEQ